MITQQLMHAATGQHCLVLEPHYQLHHASRVRTAFQQVTGTYKVCFSTAPGKVVINDVRRLQRRNQGVVSAMNIANGDNSIDTRITPLIRFGKGKLRSKAQHYRK
jgi:hypothetical protein